MLCLRVLINAAGKEDAGDSSTIPNRKWSDDLEHTHTHTHTQASKHTNQIKYVSDDSGKGKKKCS